MFTRDHTVINPPITGIVSQLLEHSIANHLKHTIGKDTYSATPRDWYHTLAYTVRDFLVEKWLETQRGYHERDVKRVYYISVEFLTGKMLENSLINLGIEEEFAEAVKGHGLDMNEMLDLESEAGLGNGGLGRLAACFLDSMATLGIPGYGYGIRYEYGMFHQQIRDLKQVEHPDNWLRYGNPWELPRPDFFYPVRFYGHVKTHGDGHGNIRHEWVDYEEVMAMAYDIPVPGFGCRTVNNLRLWSAKSSRDFNLEHFNDGNYIKAVEHKNMDECLSKILYPNDNSHGGKALRLKQEYFLVSATLHDIFRRYKKHHRAFDQFPDKVAIQMNDTHPSLAVAELMRLLVDEENMPWDKAWDITTRTINYTNHTVMGEALERWPVSMMAHILPRHLQIIYEINHRLLNQVYRSSPDDSSILSRLSIVEEGEDKKIRMANLAILGSHKVNGVSAIHTEILKNRLFRDFHEFCPEKFTNKTNGISQRVWLYKANRPLSAFITERIGSRWITNLFELRKLAAYINDAEFRKQWQKIKRHNKEALAAEIFKATGVHVQTDSIFDVHVKRIHEYKRQLLNIIHVITLYNRVKADPDNSFVPRTFIFSGKAAPGYVIAKDIIMLINSVAAVINNDPSIRNLIKVIFMPNYNVSLAEKIIPAADISEQISTAGTEASGTGCMKLALSGALTVCTLDGANIEMHEEIGEENIFVFGLKADEVASLRQKGYDPRRFYNTNPELKQAIGMIASGFFSPNDNYAFYRIINRLLEEGDEYMLFADYADYVRCQEQVAEAYKDRDNWTKKSILNVAHIGKFSSDRTIKEYAEDIWGLKDWERHGQ